MSPFEVTRPASSDSTPPSTTIGLACYSVMLDCCTVGVLVWAKMISNTCAVFGTAVVGWGSWCLKAS